MRAIRHRDLDLHLRLPPLEVVVVAYGPVGLLLYALETLGSAFPVHVVDNGRDDEVQTAAQARGADYVRPDRNVGFGSAVNIGLARVAAAADVLLLNPDARLTERAARELQRQLHAVPRTAAVAPLLRRPDGSSEPTRWPMPTPTLPWRGIVGAGGLRHGEAFFLSGAVLLLAGAALQEVGGFDERFFLYAEESDWQRRALARGFTVREIQTVQAEHVGAGTSGDSSLREAYFHGSAEIFIRKWHGAAGWNLFRVGSLLAALRRATTTSSPTTRHASLATARRYAHGPACQMPPRPTP